jgi:peptidase C39-like protein
MKPLAELRHHHSLTVVAQKAGVDSTQVTEPRASASGACDEFRLVAVCFLAVSVCAAAAVTPQPLAVPFFRQAKNGCGAASVAMVMHYWGQRQPPGNIYHSLYDAERRGIPLAGMKRYLEEAGFRAFTLQGEWADIQEHLSKGRPLIVALKGDRLKMMHFAVVTGAGTDRVWLNDPTRKKSKLVKRAEFEKQWQNAGRWLLLSTPPAN